MKKFSKNIITHQSTKQLPFIVDFLKTMLYIVVILLACIGVYSLLNESIQEIIYDRFTELLQQIAMWLNI